MGQGLETRIPLHTNFPPKHHPRLTHALLLSAKHADTHKYLIMFSLQVACLVSKWEYFIAAECFYIVFHVLVLALVSSHRNPTGKHSYILKKIKDTMRSNP